MSETFPVVYLARHGETAWTLTGQHTGRTDLPLTERGELNARRLAERLSGIEFAKVFTSPLRRAMRTCELAGFGAVAATDPDLVEWDYGQYEGRRTVDIHRERPDWQLFATAARAGSPPSMSPRERIAWSGVCARLQEMFCSFPADIFSACWPHAGLGSSQSTADFWC